MDGHPIRALVFFCARIESTRRFTLPTWRGACGGCSLLRRVAVRRICCRASKAYEEPPTPKQILHWCPMSKLTALKQLSKVLNRRFLSPRGRIEPSGFFSFSNAPQKKGDKPIARLSNDEKTLLYLSDKDNLSSENRGDSVSPVPKVSAVGGQDSGAAIGSSNPAISRKRAKRGANGITGPQRRRLFWALECLERRSPRGTLAFLTLTVPSVTEAECRIVQENWSRIVKSFIEELKRELHRKNLKPVVFGCTEIQQERLRKTGLAVPHLHLCYRGRKRNGDTWPIVYTWLREAFGRVLRNCTGLEFNDLRAVENVQCVKKSIGGYLAKYLSKCSSKMAKEERADLWHPSDWVHLGRHCRSKYLHLTRSGVEVGEFLRGMLAYPREVWASWLAPIEIPSSVGPITIGWYGYSHDFKTTVAPASLC